MIRLSKSFLALATILMVLPFPRSLACTCDWEGPFLKVAPGSDLVVRARVLAHAEEKNGRPLAMDVEVVEVLCGVKPSSRLRIWGDNGALCRPYVSSFPVGTEWVMVLHRSGSFGGEGTDRVISGCGQFWLPVKDGTVVGPVDENHRDASQTVSLEALRERLADASRSLPEARRCGPRTSSPESP